MRSRLGEFLALAALAAAASTRAAPSPETEASAPTPDPPIVAARVTGAPSIDGELGDSAWRNAGRVERFFETSPGETAPPPVATTVLIAYDDRFLYVGISCEDPRPDEIRAPFVDRDAISDTDDSVSVFLDTRGDRRSAFEFRVDPRGQQTDGTYGDATGNEDFAPDFFWESAAAIDARGWSAEMRIPFSTLRYDAAKTQRWSILIRRNYPRRYRFTLDSVPVPLHPSCLICHAAPLAGLEGLPRAGHLVVAPYAALQEDQVPRDDGRSLLRRPARGQAGVDIKWTPSPGTAIDATVHPDFSQIESDTGQISINRAFALFQPEKRPFFLEGVDLLETPIPAVYTRTITSPRWGARVTGKEDATSFTLLVAQDRGGGSVVVPGPTASALAPQPGASIAAIGRVRRDLGPSFAGLLMTDRENSGRGHNRVLGADFQWAPGAHDRVSGQFLASDTRTPDRPDLFAGWDGRRFTSRAMTFRWVHDDRRWHFRAIHDDFGDSFRADDGFVPQAGFRHEKGVAAYSFDAAGPLTRVQAGSFCDYFARPSGEQIQFQCGLYASPTGIRNLSGEIDLVIGEKDRVRDRIVRSPLTLQVYGLSIDPGRVLSRISLSGFAGDSPDFVNGRAGHGADIALTATLKPTEHLTLDVYSDHQWLDVEIAGRSSRLFTAEIERLKATCNFDARTFVRVIAQYASTRRAPRLYDSAVDRRSASFSGSALFGYRVNWQSVIFVGYGDEREKTTAAELAPVGRALFLKISYAWQR